MKIGSLVCVRKTKFKTFKAETKAWLAFLSQIFVEPCGLNKFNNQVQQKFEQRQIIEKILGINYILLGLLDEPKQAVD